MLDPFYYFSVNITNLALVICSDNWQDNKSADSSRDGHTRIKGRGFSTRIQVLSISFVPVSLIPETTLIVFRQDDLMCRKTRKPTRR